MAAQQALEDKPAAGEHAEAPDGLMRIV